MNLQPPAPKAGALPLEPHPDEALKLTLVITQASVLLATDSGQHSSVFTHSKTVFYKFNIQSG